MTCDQDQPRRNTDEEILELVQARIDKREIECRSLLILDMPWEPLTNPVWNFEQYQYRRKPPGPETLKGFLVIYEFGNGHIHACVLPEDAKPSLEKCIAKKPIEITFTRGEGLEKK